MSISRRTPAGLVGFAARDAAIAGTDQRLVLDSRQPQLLNGGGHALQVIAGHVDLFAVAITDAEGEGARQHLFRVEKNEIILDLPEAPGDAGARMQIIAVGGPGAEALILARERIEKFEAIAEWLSRLAKLSAEGSVDWAIRQPEPDEKCEIKPGERRRGAARDILWVRVESGAVRLMGQQPAYGADSPALPLTSGMWIEAAEMGCTIACSLSAPSGTALWHAIDQFQLCAVACIRDRLVAAASMEAQRLVRRSELNVSRSRELLEELSAVIVRLPAAGKADIDVADPLLAACQAAAHAIQSTAVRPPARRAAQQEFQHLVEIARASRLRARRVLLRGNWWQRDIGALVAWHGQERNPVALVPSSRHGYQMIDAKSGTRRIIDQAIAMELSPEAASLYPTLPSRSLSLWNLVNFSMRHARGSGRRIIVGALLVGALSLVVPLVTQVLVNSIIPRTELDQLTYCAAALAMTAFSMAALQLTQSIAMLRLEAAIDWKLQAALLDRLLRLPASLFRQFTVGDLADRALGVDAIRRIVTGRLLRGFMAAMLCGFSFLLMLYYDLRLALLAGVLTVLRGLIIIASNALRLYHERRHFNLQGKVEGLVLQFLSAIGKLRVAAATIRALAVWAKQFAAQKRQFIASRRAANALAAVEAAFPTLATLLIFAVVQQSDGALKADLGAFLGFFAAFGQAIASVGELATAASESMIAIPRLSRLQPLLSTATEISDDRAMVGDLSGAIELSRVTFRYLSGGPPILDNVSFSVGPGEYVAIVGPSGSGKSTIFRLLLGFESPESGAVFFDGKALQTLDVSGVRRQMGVVLQDGRLITGSIYDNICGGMQLPMEQAWAAARLTGLEADIQAMPMGMHTFIAEGVSTMSGGQRQRLMIARAIARRPRILLLDEATSSLDNRSQAIVSVSLGNLNVTRIVIAHRLSTVREADRIIVVAEGKIVQSGTYAELSATSGMFADIARRQLL
jgi:NHLM bacteriocin system ABC transporter ATP-binding protein